MTLPNRRAGRIAQSSRMGAVSKLILTGAMLLVVAVSLSAAPAFPGAEGFGAQVTGGRGGVTVAVTRLDDPVPAQPGTLRYALEMSGPRIVVFNTGGSIRLNGRIYANGDLTIAGQTAPGDGITVDGGISIKRNTIVRYLRVRPGAVASGDGLEIWETDVIIDHCSLSWASDENIGFKRMDENPDRNVTIQWTIMSEAEKGSLAWYAHKTTFHHNLFAHNYIRNPVFAADSFAHILDYRNNVVYDIGNHGLSLKGYVSANVVGNYFKLGKESRLHRYCINIEGNPPTPQVKVYLKDIYGPRVAEGQPEWNEVQYQDVWGVADESMHRVYAPFPVPPVTTHTAQQGYEIVLANAGASLKRDLVDARIVNEVRNRLNTGGYPTGDAVRLLAASQWSALYYSAGAPVLDTDRDGMPDEWEMRNGLNPYDAADARRDDNGDGYTNIEEYLNGLADGATAPAPAPVNQPPIAVAGPDQTISTSNEYATDVQLDGSASSDPEGQALTFTWLWKDAAGSNRQANGLRPVISLPAGETIVTLVVNDGTQNSAPATVKITVIFTKATTAPTQPTVTLTPAKPVTADSLTATASGSTCADGTTVTYTCKWYRDGALQSGITGSTVAASATAKGQTWRVVVTPMAGATAGPTAEASVTIGNSAPTAPTVTLAPAAPADSDSIVATASGSTDADGDAISYTWAWYRDDQIQTSVTDNTVSAALTSAGETWRAVATPTDGTLTGSKGEAAVTVAADAPSEATKPTAPTIKITPEDPSADVDLTVTASGSVAGGATVTYTYQWYADARLQTRFENQTTIPQAYTDHGEHWLVVVTPWADGVAGPAAEASVTIRNSAPTAPTVTLSPAAPTDSDDIVATATGSTDADWQDTVSYVWAWYRNGQLQSGLTGNVVSASLTSIGETWRVVAAPTDGTATGPTGEASVTIAADKVTQPAPPTAPAVKLTPAAPVTTDDLVATATGSTAPDGGSVTYTYEWHRNGAVVSNITGATVAADLTAKGETWRVVVTSWCGDTAGPAAEASVTIANSAPTATALELTPANPTGSDDIIAIATATDLDRDALTWTWAWYRNGVRQSGITQNTVTANLTAGGDTWRAVATPSDGAAAAPAVEASVTIGIAPPTAPTVQVTPAQPLTTDDLVATATGSSSPDGGAVTYRFQWYRGGEPQADLTSATVPASRTEAGDIWRVVVTPLLGAVTGPAAEASVTIIATPAPNTPPTRPTVVITPEYPSAFEDLRVEASGSTDVDGDTVTYIYRWLRNGQPVAQYDNNTVIPAAATEGGETWRCSVVASDAIAASEPAWDEVTIASLVINTPPSITHVEITPATPSALDTLAATAYGWRDSEGAAPAYRWQWFRKSGGSWVAIAGATTDRLLSGQFVKGDKLQVRCTPWDGIAFGQAVTADVNISNSPPKTPLSVRSASTVSTSQDIVLTGLNTTDADNDPITYDFEWSVSTDRGVTWTVWDGKCSTVGCGATEAGQLWQVRVRAFDGTDYSNWSSPAYIKVADILRRRLPAGVHLLALPIEPFDGQPAALLPGSAVVVYDSRASGYRSDVQRLEVGRGYWVQNQAPLDCEIEGAFPEDRLTMTFPDRGLQIMGNPFDEPLPWRNLHSDALVPFGWYYDSAARCYRLVGNIAGLPVASEIPPWAGFWACTVRDGAQVTIDRDTAAPASETSTLSLAKRDVSEWVIRLVASGGGCSDADNYIGVLRNRATAVLNPPAPATDSLDLYIAAANGERRAIDVAGQQAQRLAWDVVVESSLPDQLITVSYPDLSDLPPEYRLTLVDLDTGEERYMRTTPSYQFRSGDGGVRRHLRIVAERESLAPLGITSFTPQEAQDRVTISYALTQPASVDVAIMNMAGRPVRRLVQDAPSTSGQHALTWNMVSETGTRVPSGMYLCRLTARAASGHQSTALRAVTLRN